MTTAETKPEGRSKHERAIRAKLAELEKETSLIGLESIWGN